MLKHQQLSSECSVHVHDPVVIMSHGTVHMINCSMSMDSSLSIYCIIVLILDSLTNFGHFMGEDVLNVFLVLLLNQLDPRRVVIMNIDGLRPATIHNGQGTSTSLYLSIFTLFLLNICILGRHIHDPLYIDTFGMFGMVYRVMFKDLISASESYGPFSGDENLLSIILSFSLNISIA